jgi:hypothetical protein
MGIVVEHEEKGYDVERFLPVREVQNNPGG